MVIYFGNVPFPPLVEIRENPEFHDLMRMDKAHCPRCLLWHGWLPMLSGCNGDSLWAGTAAESAHYLVETALGGYSSALISAWSPPDGFDQSAVSCLVPGHPNVWTDGSLVLDKVAGISSSGAGFFAHQAALLWDVRTWEQVDRLRSVGDFPTCRGFCSVPGPYQSVLCSSLILLMKEKEMRLCFVASWLGGVWNGYDGVVVSSLVPDHPNVWCHGSLVLDQVTGVSSSGAGSFAHHSENFWSDRRWGHVDHVRPEGVVQSCRVFFVLFLGLSSLFRERRCGVSFWLCSLLVWYTWVLTILVSFVM